MGLGFDFEWVGASINPRQIGVLLDLPRHVDRLSWKRRGHFSFYSPSDIGRNEGRDVQPNPCDTFYGQSGDACGYSPATPWASDTNPLGSNDFRSTKDAIITYSLCTHPGGENGCVTLLSNGTANGQPGTLSARSWLAANGTGVRMLAATLSNEGGNSFTQPVAVLPHMSVKVGTRLTGEVRLHVY